MSLHPYQAVLSRRTELQPIATAMAAKLSRLENIKAIVFDIYGTLLISGSGDVGSASESDSGEQIAAAILNAGIELGRGQLPTISDLHAQIRADNEQRRSESCPKPEVDIDEVWRQVLIGRGIEGASVDQINRLSAEYESRANPTWPMPGASQSLERLHRQGTKLGIVSNAQGFTIPLVEDLAGRFGVDSVFDPNLCVFSYRYRQAKPGRRLFDVLCDGLQRIGIDRDQAVYVGNDCLNDIWAAGQAGLRTALFAGDRRSLRMRREDSKAGDVQPDIVLTHLEQLFDCI